MAWLIWAGILPLCLVVALFILKKPLRLFLEELHVDQARDTFHLQRERLEARFVTALGRADPAEGQRWEDARWHDEVVWARDRQTRCFLALVCVNLEPNPFQSPRHATAVFEYRKRRWYAEGKRLNELRPDEAVGRNRRFEPVVIVHPHTRRPD
jgi:hypothetical protein